MKKFLSYYNGMRIYSSADGYFVKETATGEYGETHGYFGTIKECQELIDELQMEYDREFNVNL